MIVVGERLAAVPGALTAAVRAAAATGARLVWIPRRAGERGAVEAGALPALLPGGRPATDPRARDEVAAVWGVRRTPAPLRPRHRPDHRGRRDRRTRRAGRRRASRSPTCPTRRARVQALDEVGFLVSLELRPSEVTDAGRRGPPGRRRRREGRHLPQLGGPGAAVRGRAQARPDDAQRWRRPTRGSCTCSPTPWTSTSGCPTCAPCARELDRLGGWDGPRADRARCETARPAAAARRRARPCSPGTGCCSTRAGSRRATRRWPAPGTPPSPGSPPPPRPRPASRTATCWPSPARAGPVELPLQVTEMPDRVVWLPLNSTGRRRHRRHRGAPRRPRPHRPGGPRRSPRGPGGERVMHRRWRPPAPPEDLSMFGRDPWWLVAIKAVFCFAFLMVTVLFSIVWERKVVAWMQLRIGPNRHGPWGMLQSLADGIKLMLKEDLDRQARGQGGLRPGADHRGHPGLHGDRGDPLRARRATRSRSSATARRCSSPTCRSRCSTSSRSPRSASTASCWPAGRSGSTYPLLGGLRSCAQMISYEIAMGAALRLGLPLLRVDVDLGDRRGAGGPLVHPAAAGLLPHLHRDDGRRDQPRAVRHAGVRGRPGRRLQHRVLVDQVRAVHARRVRQHGHRLGGLGHPLPGRLAGPVPDQHLLGGREPRLVADALVRRSRSSCCCSSSSGCAARCPACATTSS